MKIFTVVRPNGRTFKFKVRGICEFDVLNPCWDNRKDDIPGEHWGGGRACKACTGACKACTDAAKKRVVSN